MALGTARARAKRCYTDALVADPNMAGKLIVVVKLSPSGEVAAANVGAISGLSNEVAQCITHAIMTVAFDPPGEASTIRIPFNFVLHAPHPRPDGG